MSPNRIFNGLALLALLAGAARAIQEALAMPAGASGFPLALAGVVAVLSLVSLGQMMAAGPDAGPGGGAPPAGVILRGLGFVAITIAFVALFDRIGFEPAAVLMLLAGMCILDLEGARRFWWIAVVLPPVLGLAFRMGLALRLPPPQLPF